MARKGGSKEGVSRDSSQNMPVEQKITSESSKQKISKVLDVFPNATKDQVAKILKFYDDDEHEAIDALTRDGGKEALSNLADCSNTKSKNNKNKKKKKKGKKEPALSGSTTASFDADDSSSLHSGGNIDTEVEKDCSISENRNGILHDSVDENKLSLQEELNSPTDSLDSSISKNFPSSKEEIYIELEEPKTNLPSESKCSNEDTQIESRISPVSDNSDKQGDAGSPKDKYRSIREDGYAKHSRQRTSSFRRSKTSSLSEDSSSQHNAQATAVPTKRGYEKCKKDLNRQSISLQRIYTQVEKGLEESSKKLEKAFTDVKKLINERQDELVKELEKRKEEALNLLKSRQDLGIDLKRRVDRTSSLTESEWSELRSDIKQFVTERKYDEELSKTIWFLWCMDPITEVINKFGEVPPVKNVYSQRSHSALESANVTQSNPEPSPASSIVNEEITDDKTDVANISDTVEEAPPVKQEVPAPTVRTQPTENRSRVFSNKMFQQNRGGRGYNRGRGGGYGYPRNKNFNYRNTYNHFEYSENRNHYQEREGRIHDNPPHAYDRNMNRNNRNDRRGQNMGYRPNAGRFRANMGQQRQNSQNVTKTEPMSNENREESEKNVVNGYINN